MRRIIKINEENKKEFIDYNKLEKETFQDLDKNKHISFKQYSALENEVVIEVEAIFITIWKYINNKPYREYLNIADKVAVRELYINP